MYYLVSVGVNAPLGSKALSYAEKDAADLYKAFVGGEGPVAPERAKLLVGGEARVADILRAIVTAVAAQPSHLLFYFSGHGNEQGLAAADGLLGFKLLHRTLRAVNAPWSMVILDTCRAASYAAFVKEARVKVGAVPDVSWYEALAAATPGTRLIFSTGADRNSGESAALQNGLFTHAFLQGMRHAKPDLNMVNSLYVSDQRAFNYARWHMRTIQGSKQLPEEMRLTGDFPMLRPQATNEVGDGWFNQAVPFPHHLRVVMQVEGRQYVGTKLQYAVVNSAWTLLHSDVIEFEPKYDASEVTLDILLDFEWLQSDPRAAVQLALFGRASFRWLLWLEDSNGSDLDFKVIETSAST